MDFARTGRGLNAPPGSHSCSRTRTRRRRISPSLSSLPKQTESSRIHASTTPLSRRGSGAPAPARRQNPPTPPPPAPPRGAARPPPPPPPPQKLTNRLIDGIWPGSGVAVLDFDQDSDEDLFVGDGVRSILYEKDGRGHFTDVNVRAGLAVSDSSGIAATGVAAGDVDGDGYPDLVVTNAFGSTRLFRNRRDGTFEEITASSGIETSGPTRSAAFADVNGDGNLDLFVCGTGDYYGQMPGPPFDANDGRRNSLFLGDGKGHLRDVSAEWGVAKPTRWSLSCLFADFDGDGRPDLIVTNDFGLKNLYRNV